MRLKTGKGSFVKQVGLTLALDKQFGETGTETVLVHKNHPLNIC